jgi:GNAT superfamily N-acetyltransferase
MPPVLKRNGCVTGSKPCGRLADVTVSSLAPYNEGDRAAVVGLLNLITDDLGPEVLAGSLAKPSRRIQVVRDGGRAVAVMILALIEWSGDAHIRFLAVDADYRSQGIGAMLVRWAQETALMAGMRRLYVDTSHDNVRGMQFYIRQGFVPEVCRFDFYKPGLHQVNFWMDLPYTGDERQGSGGTGGTRSIAANCTIDPYTEADRPVVVDLLDAITWRGSGEGVLDDALRNEWTVTVAHDRGAAVGTLLLNLTRWNRTAHIGLLSIVPEYQSRGVGAALVNHAKTNARAWGLRRFTVGTGHQNWRAQLFYLRNGFIPEICRHDFGGPGIHEVLLGQDL